MEYCKIITDWDFVTKIMLDFTNLSLTKFSITNSKYINTNTFSNTTTFQAPEEGKLIKSISMNSKVLQINCHLHGYFL